MKYTYKTQRSLPAARDWLWANAPYDPSIVRFLTTEEVIRDIEKLFGPWDTFVTRSENLADDE